MDGCRGTKRSLAKAHFIVRLNARSEGSFRPSPHVPIPTHTYIHVRFPLSLFAASQAQNVKDAVTTCKRILSTRFARLPPRMRAWSILCLSLSHSLSSSAARNIRSTSVSCSPSLALSSSAPLISGFVFPKKAAFIHITVSADHLIFIPRTKEV